MRAFSRLLLYSALFSASSAVSQISIVFSTDKTPKVCDFKVKMEKSLTGDSILIEAYTSNAFAPDSTLEHFRERYQNKNFQKIPRSEAAIKALFRDLCDVDGYWLDVLQVFAHNGDPTRAHLYFRYSEKKKK